MYSFVVSSVYVVGNIFRVIVVDAYSVTWRIINEEQERHADALYQRAASMVEKAQNQSQSFNAPQAPGPTADSFNVTTGLCRVASGAVWGQGHIPWGHWLKAPQKGKEQASQMTMNAQEQARTTLRTGR